MIYRLFDKARKFRLSRYKKKKVRKEKTRRNRFYHLTFKVKIEDPLNPQESETEFEMVVPAKAAFYAKTKARLAIIKKLLLDFKHVEEMSYIEYKRFKKSRLDYEVELRIKREREERN